MGTGRHSDHQKEGLALKTICTDQENLFGFIRNNWIHHVHEQSFPSLYVFHISQDLIFNISLPSLTK